MAKYCLPFSLTSKYMDKVDEVMIDFIPKNELALKSAEKRINNLYEFIKMHQNQTVIVCLEGGVLYHTGVGAEAFVSLKQRLLSEGLNADFKLRFDQYISQKHSIGIDEDTKDILIDAGIPFFYEEFVRDWQELYIMIAAGVSDIYIVEEMGFEIESIAQVLSLYEIKMRVFPNVAQIRATQILPKYKAFFIRPEDIDIYAEYVDVFEIYGDYNKLNLDVLYEVYSQQKYWYGDLSEIIIGLNFSIDSRRIAFPFGNYRLNCGWKCLKGRPCHICERLYDLSKTMEDAGIIFTFDKPNPPAEVTSPHE